MNALATYLKLKDIKQSAFAASVCVDQATISKLCRGRTMPSLDLAVRIERETGGAVPATSWVLPKEAAE